VRGANEFRGAAKLGACACGCDLAGCLTSPDKSSGIRVCTRTGFNVQGFAGEHRLIELDGSTGQVHIGSHHCAQRKFHQVAAYQLRRRHSFPFAIALD
jgi:hypothetical protein